VAANGGRKVRRKQAGEQWADGLQDFAPEDPHAQE